MSNNIEEKKKLLAYLEGEARLADYSSKIATAKKEIALKEVQTYDLLECIRQWEEEINKIKQQRNK